MKCQKCKKEISICDGNCQSPFEIENEVWCSEVFDSHYCSLECLNIKRSEIIK